METPGSSSVVERWSGVLRSWAQFPALQTSLSPHKYELGMGGLWWCGHAAVVALASTFLMVADRCPKLSQEARCLESVDTQLPFPIDPCNLQMGV